MKATPVRWTEAEHDNPVEFLHRKRISGERSLIAWVNLEKGCHVAVHSHESEQIAIILSGRVRFTIGADGSADQYQLEMGGGEALILYSGVPHGVDALEDTEIIDVLSPPGPMGVDSQKR